MANYSPKPGASSTSRSGSPYDPFSMLSSASSSKAGSRSLTPANPPRPSAPAGQYGPDAFSSLLGPSFSSSKNQEKLSLAARRAAAQKEQEARETQDRDTKPNDAAAWSGLDVLGHRLSGATTADTEAKNIPITTDDDWLFGHIESTPSSKLKPTASPAPSNLLDEWDLLGVTKGIQGEDKLQTHARSHGPTSLIDSLDGGNDIPESFGTRDYASTTVERSEEPEDDILGALGKPVHASEQPPPIQTVSPGPVRGQHSRPRSTSPPPHVIGQIVEMGFSPHQARLALASTDTGLDVQQALETLLSNGVGVDQGPETVSDRPRRALSEFRDEEDDWDERRRDSPQNQPPNQRQSSPSTESGRVQKQPQSLVSDDIQERADKLLAQASEIGLSVFNRANAFWKDGKEKMQKAYEERAAKTRPTNDGRPRWMTELPDDVENRMSTAEGVGVDAFRDDREHPLPARQRDARSEQSTAERASHVRAPKTANLFDDESAVYVSPARRRPAVSRATTQNTLSSVHTPSPGPLERQSPPLLRIRETITASTSAIASSNAHKEKGAELYKLGQYANAEQVYSTAIDLLPTNHLLLIPLHNNRAQCRIKIGEHSGAIEDCTTVLSIIGPDYHPAREAKVSREEDGASVDLAGALLKAFRRRAEAHEGREKWELALKDWEAIIACEWSAKMRNEALTGASRCRRLLSPEKEAPLHDTPARRPKPRPTVSRNQQEFEAVKKLRQANQALEQEDQIKANLKDSVDARLSAWKSGKETNVRALIASLETVLWPELGWQKVGLHELVTPSQVKVRYMKAIAKLHPDKIDSSNATVEQGMIANGVFAALNESWTVFNNK